MAALIEVVLTFDEQPSNTPLVPAVLGEQFGPLAVVPGTERVEGGADRRLSGWSRVVHVATGRRLPASQLCLSCARTYAARLQVLDVDWSAFGHDKAANRETVGGRIYDIELAADLAEAGCQARWGSGWCKPDWPDGDA